MTKTTLYALDFDGVICDSAIETGLAGWKVACIVWTDMPQEIPEGMIDLFRQVRPVMETGYESALIMRHLFEGVSPDTLLTSFDKHLRHLIRRDEIDVERLKMRFGETRDNWISDNQQEWLEMNPLFEGIANKLSKIGHQNITIITTKQERFVSKILQANNISFPAEHIYGLERQLSKPQILTDLSDSHPDHQIFFVEDRLQTLVNVLEDKHLHEVQLYFADWGYNTTQDKELAQQIPELTTLTLEQFQDL